MFLVQLFTDKAIDALTWAAIATAIISLFALLVSLWSIIIARRALSLAERQEINKHPSFVLYLKNGFVKTLGKGDKKRVYAFLISISNTSESNNSIAHLDLNIILSISSGSSLTLKIPSDGSLNKHFPNQESQLSVPMKIEAHQTIA